MLTHKAELKDQVFSLIKLEYTYSAIVNRTENINAETAEMME